MAMFFRVHNSFNGIFSANFNLLFFSVVRFSLCWRVTLTSSRRVFLRFLFVTTVYILRARV